LSQKETTYPYMVPIIGGIHLIDLLEDSFCSVRE